ncbi:MAG: phosphonate metabolism protein/1,5-bisphosphokinase (PRPP-forming) PhnN [Alphaproteobacteria bacterium]|nr:phosphonate metabolism protein/1,5-bisphosphokinase (PRPP-forming) PhnN [Alphaproteobacteria bacterium]
MTIHSSSPLASHNPNSGKLFLVVGPSGSGKDSILNYAKDFFSSSGNVVFPLRCITRDATEGDEVHVTISDDEFEAKIKAGQFTFAWHAHGLKYGIPREIEYALAAGKNVVINVSRSVLAEARNRFKNLTVISISVNKAELRKRLQLRGRETQADIERRLQRAEEFSVVGDDVIRIENSGSLALSCESFIHIISPNRSEIDTLIA